MSNASVRLAGFALVAGAALLWSTGGVLVRLLEPVDAWTVSFWRQIMMVATLTLALAVVERGRVWPAFRAPGWRVLASGACFAVMMICFLLALARTSVANTLLIMAVAPLLAALLAWAVLGERPRTATWIAMGCALAGIGLMVANDLGGGAWIGNLLALAVAAAAACNIVVLRGAGNANMIPAIVLGGAISAAVSLPFAQLGGLSAREFGLLFLLGAVQLGLGCAIYVYGARHLTAAEVTLTALLETVLSPLWAWLFVGETPTRHTAAGGALVLAAIVAVTLAGGRTRRGVAAPH